MSRRKKGRARFTLPAIAAETIAITGGGASYQLDRIFERYCPRYYVSIFGQILTLPPPRPQTESARAVESIAAALAGSP